jgi:hypothetical protein|tara:strand:- start:8124 stop:8369 length:246 start_codon:yes stop_codon:yes gene_type:complete
MLINVSKEYIYNFILEEIKAWEDVCNGVPNLHAFEFDSLEPGIEEKLTELGFYENRIAWTAGIRIKKLYAYLEDIESRGVS